MPTKTTILTKPASSTNTTVTTAPTVSTSAFWPQPCNTYIPLAVDNTPGVFNNSTLNSTQLDLIKNGIKYLYNGTTQMFYFHQFRWDPLISVPATYEVFLTEYLSSFYAKSDYSNFFEYVLVIKNCN